MAQHKTKIRAVINLPNGIGTCVSGAGASQNMQKESKVRHTTGHEGPEGL